MFNHPKVEYVIGDVYQYLKGTVEKFDAMIIDVSTDEKSMQSTSPNGIQFN